MIPSVHDLVLAVGVGEGLTIGPVDETAERENAVETVELDAVVVARRDKFRDLALAAAPAEQRDALAALALSRDGAGSEEHGEQGCDVDTLHGNFVGSESSDEGSLS